MPSAGKSSVASSGPSRRTGGQVVQKLWVPLNVADWAPYLSQIRRDADAVFALAVAAAQLRFPKQYEDAGLKGRLPLIARRGVVRRVGPAPHGRRGPRRPQPADVQRGPGHPGHEGVGGEVQGQVRQDPVVLLGDVLHERRAGSTWRPRPWAARSRIARRSWPPSRRWSCPTRCAGPIKLDAYGNPIQNIYVRKVERKDGELQNTVIFTYPAVSQFWKWTPEEYLKQPPLHARLPAL